MAKKKKKKKEKDDSPLAEFGNCESCETPLGIEGGMAGTGLCGPCCTGEAATLDEYCETW